MFTPTEHLKNQFLVNLNSYLLSTSPRAEFVIEQERALTSDRHGRKCLLNAQTRNFGRDLARCTYFLCYRGAVTSVPETNASVAAADSVELKASSEASVA